VCPKGQGEQCTPKARGNSVPQRPGGTVYPKGQGAQCAPKARGNSVPQRPGGTVYLKGQGAQCTPKARGNSVPQRPGGTVYLKGQGGTVYPRGQDFETQDSNFRAPLRVPCSGHQKESCLSSVIPGVYFPSLEGDR
jgi:hypothetical protein